MSQTTCESHHAVVFKIKVSHFRVKNKLLKDTNGKGKFKWMLRFLLVEWGKILVTKSSFEDFNDVFFTAERNMSCFEIQPRQRSFWRRFKDIFCSMVRKIRFRAYINVSKMFYKFLSLALKNNYKMHLDLRWVLCSILPCAHPIYLLLRINLLVFEYTFKA